VSVRNSTAVILISLAALSSPSCVLSDGMAPDDSPREHTALNGLSEHTVLAQDAEGTLETLTECALGGETVPYSCINRYCVYALDEDSSLAAYGCFPCESEAQAYRDSFVAWKVVAGFDTLNSDPSRTQTECDGTTGHVKFLIGTDFDCSPTRYYEIPSLNAQEFGTMNDTFVSANGNLPYSGCGRIRLWEHANFDGDDIACRPGTQSNAVWCGTLGALNQRITSWRAIHE
jgi:hypothetical protein